MPACSSPDLNTSESIAAPNLLPIPVASNLISPFTTAIVDLSTRASQSQIATGTEFGGRTEDDVGSLAAGKGNAGADGGRAEKAQELNVATTPIGRVDGMMTEGHRRGGEPEMPTAQQTQTSRGGQFKSAPKFRFGSSQRPREGSPSGAKASINATPQLTKSRWRGTQTPLRQSLRRELTKEEIWDAEEELLMEGVKESIDRGHVDVDVDGEELGDITYSQLGLETPVAKRRRMDGGLVESLSHSQSLQDDTAHLYERHEETHQVLHGHEAGSIVDDQERHERGDEEMLYNDGHQAQEAQPAFQEPSHPSHPSHSSLSSHHPPAPTHSQRPRFILPTSHPPRPSTPQSHSTQQVFAPTPHFVIATPLQALTHYGNEPPCTTRTFAPTPHFFITPSLPEPTNEPQFIKPPKFIHTEEPEPTRPLPEEFSPRKRGQKFVVGGCASEVRGWLVDLETQNGHQPSLPSDMKGLGREERRNEEWAIKMVVDDAGGVRGMGWTIATGDGMNVILGGEGMKEGLERGKEVQRGSLVEIKAPVWEVDIQGMNWSVGANWKTWER